MSCEFLLTDIGNAMSLIHKFNGKRLSFSLQEAGLFLAYLEQHVLFLKDLLWRLHSVYTVDCNRCASSEYISGSVLLLILKEACVLKYGKQTEITYSVY